jgi:hypothetical protein
MPQHLNRVTSAFAKSYYGFVIDQSLPFREHIVESTDHLFDSPVPQKPVEQKQKTQVVRPQPKASPPPSSVPEKTEDVITVGDDNVTVETDKKIITKEGRPEPSKKIIGKEVKPTQNKSMF